MKQKALIFGYGFIGRTFAQLLLAKSYEVAVTCRDDAKIPILMSEGVIPFGVEVYDLSKYGSHADVILITAPPDDDGCPAYRTLRLPEWNGKWVGYLSTTGVYGDRGGGWVFEDSALEPTSKEGQRRKLAESQWLSVGAQVFRLPGLYGPGRNVIERLMDGTARRIHKPDHVFSRLHHDDCATALMASLNRPRAGGIYNLCDDEPAPADAVLTWAVDLCGLSLPPQIAFDDTGLSPNMKRFYQDNKRVSNARAKAELGWRLRYPTYREGLADIYRSLQSDKHIRL